MDIGPFLGHFGSFSAWIWDHFWDILDHFPQGSGTSIYYFFVHLHYGFGPLGKINRVVQPEVAAPDCSEECVADSPHCILGITLEEVKQAVTEALRVRGSVKRYTRAGNGMSSPLGLRHE